MLALDLADLRVVSLLSYVLAIKEKSVSKKISNFSFYDLPNQCVEKAAY